MSKKFTVYISSPPDREKLVAEILFGDREYQEQWAELNQEDATLRIEFYPKRDGQFWEFRFDAVMEALNEAKRRLTGIRQIDRRSGNKPHENTGSPILLCPARRRKYERTQRENPWRN